MISIQKIFTKFRDESKDVLGTLSKSQKNLTPLWLSSLAINFFALALPLTMLQAYDRILPYHGVGTLQSLSLLMITVFLFEFILKYLRSYLTAWAGSVFEHNSTVDCVEKIIKCDLEDFEKYGSKEIHNKFNEISKLRSFFSGQALTTVVDFPFSFIFMFIVFLIGGNLVLVPAFFFIAITFVAFYLGKKIRVEMKEKSDHDSDLYKLILESFDSIESIKSGGYEHSFVKRFVHINQKGVDASYQTLFFNGLAFNLGFIFNQFMTMGVLAVGAYKIIEGDLGVGGLAACTILSGRIMQPVQKVLGLWTRFQGLNVSFKNLSDIKKLKNAINRHGDDYPVIGKILFNKVNLKFNDRVMLRNFNATFGVGDIVTFSAHNSFTLKSLCNSILGTQRLSSGEILIDNVNPFGAKNSFHKDHISYLSADNSLFKGSVLDNVSSFGSTSKEKSLESCKVLGLNDLISTLPSGYSTQLENLGSDPVSPGVKQKVLLSRALATNAKVFIFDNADVGLDRSGYNSIFKIIGNLSSFSIILIFSDDENFNFLANKKVVIDDDGEWSIGKVKDKFGELSYFPKESMGFYERCI
jgi:ATP-binding cassette subfamily C protein LapB